MERHRLPRLLPRPWGLLRKPLSVGLRAAFLHIPPLTAWFSTFHRRATSSHARFQFKWCFQTLSREKTRLESWGLLRRGDLLCVLWRKKSVPRTTLRRHRHLGFRTGLDGRHVSRGGGCQNLAEREHFAGSVAATRRGVSRREPEAPSAASFPVSHPSWESCQSRDTDSFAVPFELLVSLV